MKAHTIALMVLITAGSAVAGINTDKPLGPLNLYITTDGEGFIVNDGPEAFQFDGYSIASAGGLIRNGDWTTIPESVAAWQLDPSDIGMTMMKAFQWATMADTPDLIAEAHLSAVATLQPRGKIPLGAAFPGASATDLTFTYVNAADGGSYEPHLFGIRTDFPCPSVGAVTLPSSLVWDVTAEPTFTINTVVDGDTEGYWVDWQIIELPGVQPSLFPSSLWPSYDWADLQAAGAVPGDYTVSLDLETLRNDATLTTTLTIVPEPTSLSLLALGALALRRRR
ncbi:MAG: PEP-CTERM sorting domain-containing protein [Planctomycetota bacterium]